MARTLEEILDKCSHERRLRISDRVDKMLLEVKLHALREELQISQKQQAEQMGISQPSVVAIEQRGNEVKISTMKRYVESMGCKLHIDIELPTGRHIGFTL